MSLFSLEHGKFAYYTDFALYGIAVIALAIFLGVAAPHEERLTIVVSVVVGLGSWTLVEYVLHRFVLHGLQPFRAWHMAHHRRPMALICTPTILSASLMIVLVFLPALWLTDLWRACALTLGVLIGYFAYSLTHHAAHHWRASSAWLKQRKRWHALHHHHVERPDCFGVTSGFWDYVSGSAHHASRMMDRPFVALPKKYHRALLTSREP